MRASHDDVRQIIGLFGQGPVKVLAITSSLNDTTDKIERYLDGNGLLAERVSTDRHASWVAVIRERDAGHYRDRLASGLIGCRIVDTLDEADEHIAEVVM